MTGKNAEQLPDLGSLRNFKAEQITMSAIVLPRPERVILYPNPKLSLLLEHSGNYSPFVASGQERKGNLDVNHASTMWFGRLAPPQKVCDWIAKTRGIEIGLQMDFHE